MLVKFRGRRPAFVPRTRSVVEPTTFREPRRLGTTSTEAATMDSEKVNRREPDPELPCASSRSRENFALVSLFVLLFAASLRGQGKIECGQILSGSLRSSERDFWTFEAEVGDMIVLSSRTTNNRFGSFSVVMDLFGPSDGRVPIARSLSGVNEIAALETGTYVVVARDSNLSVDGTGSYLLGLERLAPLERQCRFRALRCGERLGNGISSLEQDLFRIEARAGDLVSIVLQTTNNRFGSFSARADLYPPDLSLDPIMTGFASEQEFVLPFDGTYTLRIRDSNYGVDGTGSYLLHVLGLDPFCDCNGNGVRDDADQRDGTSLDENDNEVPDECDIGAFVTLRETEPGVVNVESFVDVPIRGGEAGFSYDSTVIASISVEAGPALPASAEVTVDMNPDRSACSGLSGSDGAFTVAWVNSETEDVVTPRGNRHLLTIRAEFQPGLDAGACSPIRFVSCLGGATPIENTVVSRGGDALEGSWTDGATCQPLVPVTFRRSDANGDGRFNVADPVVILMCSFLSQACSGCPDARDANDDGLVDMSDAVYLFNWRFGDGPPPPGPFPACGADPSADGLECLGITCP